MRTAFFVQTHLKSADNSAHPRYNFSSGLKRNHDQRVFAVVGDTLNPEKYAYKIKQGLLEKDYTVHCVGKELASLNDGRGVENDLRMNEVMI